MSQIPYQTAIDRIDADHYEPSPSTDWRGVRAAFHISTKGGEVIA